MSGSSPSNASTPYEATAEWYDAIYAARGRSCHQEIERISRHWVRDGRSAGSRRILDAGCGSGAHFEALSQHGRVTGIDRSAAMLKIAEQKSYERLECVDLRSVSLDTTFDLVVSLFGVCGYLADQSELSEVLKRLGAHLAPGGSLLVEPPLLEERFEPPRKAKVETRWEGGILSRSTTSRRVGSHLELEFEWRYQSAGNSPTTPTIDRVLRESHRMLLLSSDAWVESATSALGDQFDVHIDPEGPGGRGVLVAISRDGVRDSG